MSNKSNSKFSVIDDEDESKALLHNSDMKPINSKPSKDVIMASIGYMFAMGVCGVILVALGSTLKCLAKDVGSTAVDIGTVFIARGIGAIFGAITSAKLYKWFKAKNVMCVALLEIVGVLCWMPFCTSVYKLHGGFFLLGLGTAITDTGCQIMTRKLHGKAAGPWLGANTVFFGISGAFVPLIQIIAPKLYKQYFILAVVVLFVTAFIYFGPDPERDGRLVSGPPPSNLGSAKNPSLHYRVEIVIGMMVFCLIGGKVTSTAYISSYIDDTNVLSSDYDSKMVLVLWIAITIGRLAGVLDQWYLTNTTLPIHLSVLLIGGFTSMLLILWFPNSAPALWIGIAFYGLFNGPCVGYCYDLNNRFTHPSEKSMAIVMFGLNFGASLVPYLTTVVWNAGAGPKTLITVVFLSMFIPLPLLHCAKYLSYDPLVNPRLKYNYRNIVTFDSSI